MMIKEGIRVRKVIAHIMDSMVGMPVLSDGELEFGSEFAEFIKEHISKVTSGDDCKECSFYEEQSEVYKLLINYTDDDFVAVSKEAAELLYGIMNSNIEIPSADLMIVRFQYAGGEYMALLKMNYKESYTHRTLAKEDGNTNEIIKHKSILPGGSQRLQEAAIINLENFGIQLIEKKYEVNGEKTNYFSYLFLKCSSRLSHKTKLTIVSKAVESIQKGSYDESEQFARQMEAKRIISDTLGENGSFAVEEIAEKIFEAKPDLKIEFQEKMEKYDMVKEEIAPQSEKTTQKYQKQYLTTDTGIEIKIPMEQYKDENSVEFITNPDGTISVLIKNIGHLTAKF